MAAPVEITVEIEVAAWVDPWCDFFERMEIGEDCAAALREFIAREGISCRVLDPGTKGTS